MTPVGQFVSRLHPTWINKMPDSPLPYRFGVTPMSFLGAAVQHAVHLGDRSKLTGVGFIGNGLGVAENGAPSLNPRPEELTGSISFGGRLGVFATPQVELGLGGVASPYGPSLGRWYGTVTADAAWTGLEGVDVRAEYVHSAWQGGGLDAMWTQVAWRMLQVDSIRWLEPAVRFGWAAGSTFAEVEGFEDEIGPPATVQGAESALTLDGEPAYEFCVGANAYLRSNVVAKVAYIHRIEVFQPTVRLQIAFGY